MIAAGLAPTRPLVLSTALSRASRISKRMLSSPLMRQAGSLASISMAPSQSWRSQRRLMGPAGLEPAPDRYVREESGAASALRVIATSGIVLLGAELGLVDAVAHAVAYRFAAAEMPPVQAHDAAMPGPRAGEFVKLVFGIRLGKRGGRHRPIRLAGDHDVLWCAAHQLVPPIQTKIGILSGVVAAVWRSVGTLE